jgi:hypothetical protein
MTRWGDLAAAEPVFADRVRRTFAVGEHATLATLRRDGSPRISGTEVEFDDDAGQVVLGSMPGAVKALDLRRDPRLALHCPTVDAAEEDPGSWPGEGKVSGLAVEVSDPHRFDEPRRFHVDLTEVVLTAVGTPADHLVITSWRPGRGLVRRERR